MQKNYILIVIGFALFIISIIYIVWNQTSVINKIFKEHQEQLQIEIKAIKAERFVLKQIIDSLDAKINLEQKNLLNDIDNFLKSHDKK